ncbi:MAG: hypothetical protein ACO3CU_00640, partial [Candidatus Nanopelagicales bacterium]
MTLTAAQSAALVRWRIDQLEQVDDHPFAWWAMRGEDYVVVKAGDVEQRRREAVALRAFDGDAATSVVEHDLDLGLLVTERLLPGDDIRPLARADDDTRIIPGHGPLSDRAGLLAYREMLSVVSGRIGELVGEGKSLD